MSLIPFILDLADELHEFSRCLANGVDINDFGFGLYAGPESQHQQSQQQQQQQQQQQSPRRSRASSFSSLWMPLKRHHPYNRIKTACCAKTNTDDAVANPSNPEVASASPGGTPGKSASYSVVNKNGFQVSMNVKQFAPNELSVKTIDNCIVVEGRHDDKEDGHGVISRHFVRKYMLPKGYDPNDVLSTLSSDGILTVKAPPPPPPATKNDERHERIIEIQSTPGPTPAVMVSVSSSAKETPQTKEQQQTKKCTSPPSRLECQLPEKRQKLDVANEQVMKEKTPPPTPSVAASEAAAAAPPPAEATSAEAAASNDVVMENVDEATNENDKKVETETQQKQISEDNDENDKTIDIKEKIEKHQPKESEEEIDETEKELLEDKSEKSNGETKNSIENSIEFESIEEESCILATSVTDKEIDGEILTEINISIEKSNITKMDVDEIQPENNDVVDETITTTADNKTNNTNDSVTAVNVAAADTAAAPANMVDNDVSNNKTTNSDTSTHNNAGATETIKETTTTDKNSAVKLANSEEVKEEDTGKLPVDIPNSNEAAKTTAEKTNAAAIVAAESVLDGDEEIETAVLTTNTTTTTTTATTTNNTTETTTNTIDDVALLKAAVTADSAENSAADENVVLSEPMEGIIDGEDSAKVETTVECSSLFNKSHLGNGNTTTTLVSTEEMAN